MPRFSRLLIANRGEIACRIARSAAAAGYETVAVYSQADADAPHVRAADMAVCIGAAPPADSYLRIEAVIEAARRTGADAVHPGYGFLAEDPRLAEACREQGLVFVGPPAEAIAAMGDKVRAKAVAEAAGVPTVPGYTGPPDHDDALLAAARDLGFPLLVKAAAGGGGRGMRCVRDPACLPQALAAARREAAGAFGDRRLFLERWVEDARHVEVQVAADAGGRAIHLGERDCSIQRRHQKVVEEAPSPAVDDELRGRLGAAAVALAQTLRYEGVGTVEFLLAADGKFYFLEMNTRLQVEHPVTECVTGLDLVDLQLRVAAGEPLPLRQEDVTIRGHAIEARLYAEDPWAGFAPQAGRVAAWCPPKAPGVRVDAAVARGMVVTPHYDPLLAKVVAWGDGRETARRRLRAALRSTFLAGVRTNRRLLLEALDHPVFAEGGATTSFLNRHMPPPPQADPGLLAAAAVLWVEGPQRRPADPWSNRPQPSLRLTLEADGAPVDLRLVPEPGGAWHVTVEGTSHRVRVVERATAGGVEVDGCRVRVYSAWTPDELYVQAGTEEIRLRRPAPHTADAPGTAAGPQIRAPSAGRIAAVAVRPGQEVAQGEGLLRLEAMKIETTLAAPMAGRVAAVYVTEGAAVTAGDLLVTLEPTPDPDPAPPAAGGPPNAPKEHPPCPETKRSSPAP